MSSLWICVIILKIRSIGSHKWNTSTLITRLLCLSITDGSHVLGVSSSVHSAGSRSKPMRYYRCRILPTLLRHCSLNGARPLEQDFEFHRKPSAECQRSRRGHWPRLTNFQRWLSCESDQRADCGSNRHKNAQIPHRWFYISQCFWGILPNSEWFNATFHVFIPPVHGRILVTS